MSGLDGYDLSIVRENRERSNRSPEITDYFPDHLSPDPAEHANYQDGVLTMYRGTTFDRDTGDFVEESQVDGYLDRGCSELYFTVDEDIATDFADRKRSPSDSAWTPGSVPVVAEFAVPLDHAAIVSVPASAPDAMLERNMTDEKEYIGHHQVPMAWMRDITALDEQPLPRDEVTDVPFDTDVPVETRPLTYRRE